LFAIRVVDRLLQPGFPASGREFYLSIFLNLKERTVMNCEGNSDPYLDREGAADFLGQELGAFSQAARRHHIPNERRQRKVYYRVSTLRRFRDRNLLPE
jgi:hypothetical protein